jgi:hypothetical protein
MTAIEHHEIRGITVKNMVVTAVSAISIMASVMTTYFNLKSDVSDVRATQETQTRVNDIRLKLLESQVGLLQQEVHELKDNRKS